MLKNQKLAEQIFDSLNLAIEAERELLQYAQKNEMHAFSEIAGFLFSMLQRLAALIEPLKKEEQILPSYQAMESILDSLQRIIPLMESDRAYALSKIEFELIPLTEEGRANFYFWSMVSGDKEKEQKYLQEDIRELARNTYIEKSVETGKWKYDLSIFVLAYNKLDYTKKCIDSLLKYYPRFLKTELILVNHGSDDETKEYFEQLHPDKQLDIKVNGGGLFAVYRIIEGKYVLSINNDVFVQKNTIKNLYECISSNPKIGFAVPSTPNVSNLQTIPSNYTNESELEAFCTQNNIKNPDRWEQRTRLCDPINMINSEIYWKLKPSHQYFSVNPFSFPDDQISLLCRRNGYPFYLVKDAYCFHCGSVTLNEEQKTNSQKAFLAGRANFLRRYGIDPWYKCAFSNQLFQQIEINKTGHVNILAVNGGLGGNGLKIKELLKENVSNRAVYLKYFLTDDLYYDDVKYLGDCAVVEDGLEKLLLDSQQYDYIVAEDIDDEKSNLRDAVKLLISKCKPDAMVFLEVLSKSNEIIEKLEDSNQILDVYKIQESDEKMWAVIHIKEICHFQTSLQ